MMATLSFRESIRVHNQIAFAHTRSMKVDGVVNNVYIYSVTQEMDYVRKKHAEEPGNTATFWMTLQKVVLVTNCILPLFI